MCPDVQGRRRADSGSPHIAMDMSGNGNSISMMETDETRDDVVATIPEESTLSTLPFQILAVSVIMCAHPFEYLPAHHLLVKLSSIDVGKELPITGR